ncbi:MAG: hypothetical protein KY462_05030 [Actinobacteria bacterium]|nr:hypothetical protein [Actinomycetota bacterium]
MVSCVAAYLLRTSDAAAVSVAVEDPEADLHAPEMLDVEIASTVRGL